MQNLSANFLRINLLTHFNRFISISFWEQTFSLPELMSCFTEDAGNAV